MNIVEAIQKKKYPKFDQISNALGEQFYCVEDMKIALLFYPTRTNFPMQILFFTIAKNQIITLNTVANNTSFPEILSIDSIEKNQFKLLTQIKSYELDQSYQEVFFVSIHKHSLEVTNEQNQKTIYEYRTVEEWNNHLQLGENAFFKSYFNEVILNYLIDGGVIKREEY